MTARVAENSHRSIDDHFDSGVRLEIELEIKERAPEQYNKLLLRRSLRMQMLTSKCESGNQNIFENFGEWIMCFNHNRDHLQDIIDGFKSLLNFYAARTAFGGGARNKRIQFTENKKLKQLQKSIDSRVERSSRVHSTKVCTAKSSNLDFGFSGASFDLMKELSGAESFVEADNKQ